MSVKKLKRFDHIDPYDSALFTCLNYPCTEVTYPERDFVQIASFDPGVVNTGCRIERREIADGDLKVTTIQQRLINTKDGTGQHYFISLKNALFSIASDLRDCDYILIESQMRTNPEAIRMSQHIISTLLCIIDGTYAQVIEILPTVKSKSFGIKGLKGRDLKLKAVELANKVLTERNDTYGLECIRKSKKKDDHSDVVLYCDAWYRYLEVRNFSEEF